MSDRSLAALEARVAELETQLAFQDDLHHRLDATVARQDREILELKQRLSVLADRLREMNDATAPGEGPVDEVPPHY
ncbi:MAG: SlyX family protein [Xanthomonadales bacterium]|jgi:SlyX protein|nr:SlyX family protein [Xanthomonadales bacterium]